MSAPRKTPRKFERLARRWKRTRNDMESDMSLKRHEFGSLVCIYAQLLPKIREAAKGMGYALAIHGSMKRDFDILAVPWVEEAAPAEKLVERIAEEVGGFVVGDQDEKNHKPGELSKEPTAQPHGRKSWNICWGGKVFLDLSVMPRRPKLKAPSDEALDEYAKELNAE